MSVSNISSRTVSTKGSQKSNKSGVKRVMVRKPSRTDENTNVTIRLSDLGIIKRSPSELDLQIQGGRVCSIFDGTIKKLQMAVCVPRLLRRDGCLLRRFMQPQEVEFILGICNKYVRSSSTSSSFGKKCPLSGILSSIDKISMNESRKRFMDKYGAARDKDVMVDPHMAQVMEMLWNNKPLREKVLTEFQFISKNHCTVFVNCITTLKEVAEYKFNMTAIEERTREKHLRKAWKTNSLIEENIRNTQELLNKQRQELGEQLQIKQGIVVDYQSRIEALKTKFKDDTRHKIQDSERDMAEDTQASELRQVELTAEAKAVTQQYETLLTQHLAFEKGLRAKRFKVETQLCSWLAKYDADIGERQAEFEEITKGYEEEKAEMEALQEKFDEQEEEYSVLMAEKEEEEQRIWEERAYEYLKIRSARKIQRCWRAYRQRKIDRKKAKKAKAKAKKQKSEEKGAGDVEEGEEGAEGAAPPPESDGKKGKKDKGKGRAKGKGKKDVLPPSADGRGPDFGAALENKFGGELLGDLKGEEFSKKEVVVDLSADPAGVTGVKME